MPDFFTTAFCTVRDYMNLEDSQSPIKMEIHACCPSIRNSLEHWKTLHLALVEIGVKTIAILFIRHHLHCVDGLHCHLLPSLQIASQPQTLCCSEKKNGTVSYILYPMAASP